MRSGRAFRCSAVLLVLGGLLAHACTVDDSVSGDLDPAPTIPATGKALPSPQNATVEAEPTPVAVATRPAVPLGCAAPYPGVTATTMCTDPAGMQRATVERIVDGDTFDATVDGAPERIRIFGIDTPERGDDCFREASDTLASLAATEVLLVPDERNRDSSGRLLRYVYRPDGLSIDAAMIAMGMARAWTRDGALREPLVAIEARTRLDHVGCLW